jgi:hypothetical protein
MHERPLIYFVHCIDTEGPLDEDLFATFGRLKSIFDIELPQTKENLKLIQEKKIDLNGIEDLVAKCFDPKLLKYNRNWDDISKMLNIAMSKSFRNELVDDFNGGWVYSWHCMDHLGFLDNPRHKDIGYGNVFKFYRDKITESNSFEDEINWHFHPLSITRHPLHAATSYTNSFDILTYILCRRIIEDNWFPSVNRPGFHSERPDSHLFLEQWIPYDYANQRYETDDLQPDLTEGRFGDWTRSPKTWRGYHPDHFDYQSKGNCRRKIFRCLNIGTRLRQLNYSHIEEAYYEAKEFGNSIIAFANHDYRDIIPDVNYLRDLIKKIKKNHPDVLIKFSGSEAAAVAIEMVGKANFEKPDFKINFYNNKLIVELTKGEIFGSQPFLAIKAGADKYYHDNFDTIDFGKKWQYVFDEQTIVLKNVSVIGVGSAGRFGSYVVKKISINEQ